MIGFKVRHRLTIILCVAALCLGGCVTKQWTTGLEIPNAMADSPKRAGTVVIRSVRDARRFQKAAADAGTPSLVSAGEGSEYNDIKSRAIGCKRSEYRVAADVKKQQIDVVLSGPLSVEDEVRELLRNALTGMGYRVEDGENAIGVITLDVTIDRFWAWNSPALTTTFDLMADVATTVDIKCRGNNNRVTIFGGAKKKAMSVGKKSWVKIYRMAFKDYLENANEVLSKSLP